MIPVSLDFGTLTIDFESLSELETDKQREGFEYVWNSWSNSGGAGTSWCGPGQAHGRSVPSRRGLHGFRDIRPAPPTMA